MSKNGGDYSALNKRINKETKILFSYLSQDVIWNLYDKVTDAYYNGKPITEKKLNEEIIPESLNKKILIIPIHRDETYHKYIELPEKSLSYKELFIILHKVYREQISSKELKSMEDDYWNYISDAIKKIKKGKVVHLIDIMGSLCRVEFVRHIYQDVYELMLGS